MFFAGQTVLVRIAAPIGILCAMLALTSAPSTAQAFAPCKIITTKTVGGDGRFDYVYADDVARRLYIPHIGPTAAMNVFDLDTLTPVGSIVQTSGHGVVVDQKTHHAFVRSGMPGTRRCAR